MYHHQELEQDSLRPLRTQRLIRRQEAVPRTVTLGLPFSKSDDKISNLNSSANIKQDNLSMPFIHCDETIDAFTNLSTSFKQANLSMPFIHCDEAMDSFANDSSSFSNGLMDILNFKGKYWNII